jgi:hypothetical protein
MLKKVWAIGGYVEGLRHSDNEIGDSELPPLHKSWRGRKIFRFASYTSCGGPDLYQAFLLSGEQALTNELLMSRGWNPGRHQILLCHQRKLLSPLCRIFIA